MRRLKIRLARILLEGRAMNAVTFPALPALPSALALSDTPTPHAHTLEVLQHSSLLRAMLVVLRSSLPPPLEHGASTDSASAL
jgi:hypothetical protein